MSLIQELAKRKLLDPEKAAYLEYEAKTSGKKEEEIILEKRIVSEDVLFKIKAKRLGVPLKKVFPEDVSLDLLELIPEKSAEYYKVVPLSVKDNVVEIGMVYPEDLKAQEAIKFLSRQGKFSYKVFLITLSDYEKIFRKYRGIKKEVTKALEELEVEMKEEKEFKPKELDSEDWRRLVEEAPISKITAVLLRHAVEGNASDIHIEPVSDRLRVRFRVMGRLHSSIFLPISYLPAIVARVKILSNLRIDETRIPQDGRFRARIDEREIDFRVSTFPTAMGEKVEIRILDPDMGLKVIEDLGLEDRNFKVVTEGIARSSGMILATGPTGSGKTTTLYAILQTLNKEKVNIVTLEDPVEYFIEGINQSQIRPEIGYTFATGLRYVLRQDPDIIMIGEMRDPESAKLAIHAALTGHLVLSTLHTFNVVAVIPRLVNLGIEPYLIPVALNVAISQRLVRKLCDHCKKKVKPSVAARKVIMDEIESLPPLSKKHFKIPKPLYIWEAVGCKQCNKIGYTGRIGVFEVLKMTRELAELVYNRSFNENEIAKLAFKQGMITMRQDAIIKVLQGVTTMEEALQVVEEE